MWNGWMSCLGTSRSVAPPAPSASSAAQSVTALPRNAWLEPDVLFYLLPRLNPLTPRLAPLPSRRSLPPPPTSAQRLRTSGPTSWDVRSKETADGLENNEEEDQGRCGGLEGRLSRLWRGALRL